MAKISLETAVKKMNGNMCKRARKMTWDGHVNNLDIFPECHFVLKSWSQEFSWYEPCLLRSLFKTWRWTENCKQMNKNVLHTRTYFDKNVERLHGQIKEHCTYRRHSSVEMITKKCFRFQLKSMRYSRVKKIMLSLPSVQEFFIIQKHSSAQSN